MNIDSLYVKLVNMKIYKAELAMVVVLPFFLIVKALLWSGYFILSRLGIVSKFKKYDEVD